MRSCTKDEYMIRRVLSRLAARWDDEGEVEDERADRSRFVPSRLDSSVRYAHGDSAEAIDREMARIETRAELLEEQHREE